MSEDLSTICGTRPKLINGVYVYEFPGSISQALADKIKRQWREAVGTDARLIVVDQGATVRPLGLPLDPATPIYDGLASEFGWSA